MHHFKRTINFLIFFFLFFFSFTCFARKEITPAPFHREELNTIKQYLLQNIMTEKRVLIKKENDHVIHSIPGAVLASPSLIENNFSQDYQFHWTRDAAITMQEVVYLYEHASSHEKKKLKPYLLNYIQFEKIAQQQISRPGEETLGQPKYNIDGTIWEGDWGRPQNDGPALRAITIIHIARLLMEEGEENVVRNQLLSIIKTDLNYLAAVWQNSSFDLWEEVNDKDHFFTKMVQRKALLAGADLFTHFQQNDVVLFYLKTANQIETSLENHWQPNLGYFSETIHQQYYKGGGLNSALILAALYGDIGRPGDRFALDDERMLSSVYFIRNAFAGLYKINLDFKRQPPLIGRYPNDIYDGGAFIYGNPWILTTNALAEYYYALAKIYLRQGWIRVTPTNVYFFRQLNCMLNQPELITQKDKPEKFDLIIHAMMKTGDDLLLRVKHLSSCYDNGSCLHFAEQADRSTGEPRSAKDLTWGYTTLLRAMQMRESLRMDS